MNGGASESFEQALNNLAQQNHFSDDNFNTDKIVITKYIGHNDPDPSTLSPQLQYALWAEQVDQPLGTEIPFFVPLGGGMKVVGGLAKFNYKRSGHIFRNSSGHVNPTTKASEDRYINLFENTTISNNINNNILGGFQRNNSSFIGYSKQYRNGEVWVQTREGEIINAGVNK